MRRSEPFTIDPENPPPEKDYNEYFKTLKDGITGKEYLERSPMIVYKTMKQMLVEISLGDLATKDILMQGIEVRAI
ncbi:hypothetical protein RCOM_1251030 [Ricinus communis]|uniref:Uncharacterized protein n=1 Tax=Ricinus communis TaxID=3988 RepID=B9S8D1_RICCO|nr:hypothetical protein RCOM_1251030 [Ricinus communis]